LQLQDFIKLYLFFIAKAKLWGELYASSASNAHPGVYPNKPKDRTLDRSGRLKSHSQDGRRVQTTLWVEDTDRAALFWIYRLKIGLRTTLCHPLSV
jgi:hypothetical protein